MTTGEQEGRGGGQEEAGGGGQGGRQAPGTLLPHDHVFVYLRLIDVCITQL